MHAPSAYLSDPISELLAEIALQIQLSPTDYKVAADRYTAISDHIDRPDSPLAGCVQLFYPQGSLAIHAAIASGTTDDKFDLDVVAELDLSPEVGAKAALDRIYDAINGSPDSPYHGSVERHSRCATVQWDKMHLDVTPARRRQRTPDRESDIFHHDERLPASAGYSPIANPFGFAEWVNGQMEEDRAFAEDYAARDYSYRKFLAEAEQLPIPSQEQPLWKSPRLVVLQLLKRWRNIRYANRTVRPPPSVVLSTLAVQAPGKAASLFEELRLVANRMQDRLEHADDAGKVIEVANPVCADDLFTDRWPKNLAVQRVFLNDLRELVLALGLAGEDNDLEALGRELGGLFGAGPENRAVRRYAERLSSAVRGGAARPDRRTGRIAIAAAGGAAAASNSGGARPHTFYGAK